jgi:hypothetical protein
MCMLQHGIALYAVIGSHDVIHGSQPDGLATNMLATNMLDWQHMIHPLSSFPSRSQRRQEINTYKLRLISDLSRSKPIHCVYGTLMIDLDFTVCTASSHKPSIHHTSEHPNHHPQGVF